MVTHTTLPSGSATMKSRCLQGWSFGRCRTCAPDNSARRNRSSISDLEAWVRPKMRSNLRRTVGQLEHEEAFIHQDGDAFKITRSGMRHVESSHLLDGKGPS